jgi:hydroxymethylbilane synthase
MPDIIKIGTRGSELALWQANHVADLLRRAYPNTTVELVTFTTKGDKVLDKSLPAIGGKGLFTQELESALLNGEIDCAVHSLKDLPTEQPEGLTIGAVPQRAHVEDVLVSKNNLTLDQLPQGAKIGTSSLRRAAQLRHYRPDFQMIDIRGNVPTRISKALDPDSNYDATVLAQAGVERLGMMDKVAQIIPLEIMLPAPGQGAIGVQCRDSTSARQLFSKISDEMTWLAVSAERQFLNRLQGGCSVPVAAYGSLERYKLNLQTRVLTVDGLRCIENNQITRLDLVETITHFARVTELADNLAFEAIEQGADKILVEVKNANHG